MLDLLLTGIVLILNRFTYAWIPERKPIVLGLSAATACLLGVSIAVGLVSRFGESSAPEAVALLLIVPILMAAVGALMCIAALQIYLLLLDGPTAGFHRRAVRVRRRLGHPDLLGGAMFTPIEDLRSKRR